MRCLIIMIMLPVLVFPQSLQINWQNCFGGSDFDNATDLIKVNDGYLLAGYTSSNDGDIGYFHGGMNDIWLVKTDDIGNLIWEKSYGGSSGEICARFLKSSQNEYYIIGASASSDGDISNDLYPNSSDFWIVRIDSLGNIIWEKIVGGNGLDYIWTGTLTTDGGVIALGWTGSTDGDITVNYGAYDMWMVKLNNQGEKEWDFSLGASWFDYGMAIIQTSDGGYLVGGQSMLDEGGNLNCIPHSYKYEAVLVKLDSARNIEWQRCYGGTEDDGIWTINELSDGYIFAGFANSNDGDITGWHGDGDIWVVRIDFNGNIIWQKCLGGTRYEYSFNIIDENDGDFTIIGATRSEDGDVFGNHTLSEYYYDIWVVRLSSEGDLLWQQCIGGGGNEQVLFGALKKDYNKYIIAGQTDWGPSYDVECTTYNGSYADEYWLFEMQDTTVCIDDIAYSVEIIKVQPNPAEMEITLTFQNTEHHTSMLLECYNIYGQKMHSQTIYKGQQQTKLNVSNWSKGMYFAVVKSDGTVAGQVRFIVQNRI